MHRSIFVGPVDRASSSMVCDAQLLGQRFENVAVDHGHLVQKKDRHAKQRHNFLVPLREIKLRFVVCAQIKQAVQSGSPNLGEQACDNQSTLKKWWRSHLCVFDLDICSRYAGRRGRLTLQAVYDRPKEDGREQETFT